MLSGRIASCACGQLSAETHGEEEIIALCSCLQCHRRTGSAFSVHAFFPRDAVVVRGTSRVFRRSSASGRFIDFHFCPACGSTVYWVAEARPRSLGIAGGAFADPAFPPPQSAIWCEGAMPWVGLPDDIAHHQQGTPSPSPAGNVER